MPLTTVSRKVSELEAHLRTQFFNRTSRRITLTEAGRTYVATCRRILEDVGEAERTASGEYSTPKGDLVITAPIVFGRLHVLPVVLEFLRAYRDIAIRLSLTDRSLSLLEDHVDLAARIGALPDSSLVATRVGSIRRMVCASPRYFAERGKPKRPDELAAHDCVTFQGLSAPEAWTFSKGKSDMTVAIRSRLIVNTAEAAIDAAIAGAGITRVLCYQIAEARRSGALDIALENFEPTPWPVSLVYPGQGRLPLKLRAFLDFAAPRLKARLLQSAV
jgi:DNA-binding transcriptional LysR family regulator